MQVAFLFSINLNRLLCLAPQTVEWDMLLFFAAMFVMIEASVEVGMIGMIGGWLESAIRATPEGSRLIVAIQILLWVSAVISGMLDNIPYTITMGRCAALSMESRAASAWSQRRREAKSLRPCSPSH